MFSMTTEEYQDATDRYQGFCTNCQGITGDCCEPDARKYICPDCGLTSLYGIEESLMNGYIDIVE